MRNLRPATDLDLRKFDIKQIFLHTPARLGPRTYHEEQTTKRSSDLKVSRTYYQRIPAVIAIVTLAI